MAQNDEWWNADAPEKRSAGEEWWSADKPEASAVDRLKDFGLSVAKGVVGVPEAAVGVADIFTGGRAGKILENKDGAIGFRPKQAKEYLGGLQSDAYKAEQQEFDKAEGLVDKTVAAVSNPALIVNAVGESVPSMLAGGALARTAGAALPSLAGRAGLTAAGEGAMMAGSQAEQIRQQTEDGLLTPKQAGLAAATGVVGGTLGALGNKAAQKLGVGDVDQMIARGAIDSTTKPGLGFASRAGRGALTEGVFEELPQSLAETGLQNVALDRPVTQGMDEAAVMGVLTGGAMGAGAGVVSGFGRQQDGQAASDPAPIVPTGNPPSDSPVVATTTVDIGGKASTKVNRRDGSVDIDGVQVVPPAAAVESDSTLPVVEQAEAPAMGAPLNGAGAGLLGAPVDPLRSVIKPSEAMGLNPAAGPLSRAAVTAVDSGASPAASAVADPLGAAPVVPAPQPAQVDMQSLASRSDEELRGFLRNAQDTNIRKAVSAELARRKQAALDAMPDPLSQPQGEPARGTQAAQAEPQAPAAQPAGELKQPRGVLAKLAKTKKEKANAQEAAATPAAQPAGAEADAVRRPGVSGVDQPVQVDALKTPSNFTGNANGRMGTMTRANAGPGFTASDVTRNVQDATQGTAGTQAQAQADQATEAARGDGAETGRVPDTRSGDGVRADGVDGITRTILDSIADQAKKTNRKYYDKQIAKGLMTRDEADRRIANDDKMWSEQKVNDRTERIAKAIAEKDPTVLVGAWAKEGQGTYGNEGSMEAFRKLTGINLARMNSADRAKAIFDWAGWSEDQVRADVEKRRVAKAEMEAAAEAKRIKDDAEITERIASKTALKIDGKEGETTVKSYIDDLIQQGYTEIGQTKVGAIKRTLLYRPGANSGYPMKSGILADYAKVASQRFKESQQTADAVGAIAEAAHEAATSPKNDIPQPTDAQKEAGNYAKGHVSFNGLNISIENPAGTKRNPEWPALKNHYGYFKGSVGADKDHVDVFLTDRAADASLPVFVVDQVNADGSFDEHKVVLGVATEAEARQTYLQNYEEGWSGLGAITQMSLDDFKAWLADPAKTKKPVALKRGVLAKVAERKARRKADEIRNSQWADMTLGQRERVAEAIGRQGSLATRLAEKSWDKIDAETQAKLRAAMEPKQPAAAAEPQAPAADTTQAQQAEPAAPIGYSDGQQLGSSDLLAYFDSVIAVSEKGQKIVNPRFQIGEVDQSTANEIARFIEGYDGQQRRLRVSGRTLKHVHESRPTIAREIVEQLPSMFTKPDEVLPDHRHVNKRALLVKERSTEAGQSKPNSYVATVEVEIEVEVRDGFIDIVTIMTAPERSLRAARELKKNWPEGQQRTEQAVNSPRPLTPETEANPEADSPDTRPVTSSVPPEAAEAQPTPQPTKAEDRGGKIEDLGEKIGGARKDTATNTGKSVKKKTDDDRPAWARRYQIAQIADVQGIPDAGRWTIRDTRNLDWNKQPKLVTRETFDTQEAAEAMIPVLSVGRNHRAVPTRDGKYEIWRDISDRKRVKIVNQTFDTREDALKYMFENAVEIIEANTTFGEADLPKPENTVRVGAARRTGNVQGKDFMETFGFRGVEFGNWNNQDERQEVMNEAYDGLIDLAEVMGIPPKAISMGGELAIAFGARGHGLSGARAHYEPAKAVINLTKMNGAGALAHEWFHAMDHYFGRQDGKASKEWVTNKDGTRSLKASSSPEGDLVTSGFSRKSGVREEVREAYNALMDTIAKKAETYVEDTARADKFVGTIRDEVKSQLDSIRRDLAEQKDPRYYKTKNKPASAEQLAEFDTVAQQILDGTAVETKYMSVSGSKSLTGGRWSNDALEKISGIYKAVRGRSGFDSTNQRGMLDRLRGTMSNYSQRLKMLADAQSGAEKVKKVPTEFAMEARSLDQGRGTDYWTTPHEMGARAFQGYVEDRIAEMGGKSPFLNYGPENAGILTPWGVSRPYPYGAERKAINAAIDKLVKTIQTRETDSGNVEMFSIAEQQNRAEQHKPASEVHRKAVEGFAARLNQQRSRPVVMEAVTPGTGEQGKKARSVAAISRKLFGREVVFVRFPNGDPVFNGAVSRANPGKIFLNIDSARPLMAVLGHELLHELRKSNPMAYAELSSRLDKLTRNYDIYSTRVERKYREAGMKSLPADVVEELHADMVGDHFTEPEFWQALTMTSQENPLLWKRVINTIQRWMQSVFNKMGRLKETNDGDLMMSVAQQADGKRPFGTNLFLSDIDASRNAVLEAFKTFDKGPQSGRGDSFDVAAGRDQTKTEAFKRWFKGSKVVDANGEPLVVYHGTTADFDAFDNAKTGANDRGLWGRGHYFSASVDNANSYALRQGDGARLIHAYVSIQNPLILKTGSDLVTRMPDGTNTRELIGPNLDGAKIKQIALDGGHDGVIQIRPNGLIGDLVAFRPEQIKSAIGNRGTFDPDNADIRFSIADAAVERIKQFDVKEAPRNTWGHYRGMLMQTLGRRQIVDLFQQELPQLVEYDRLVQNMDAEKNDSGAEADRLAGEWGKLDRVTGKDGEERRLAELMHDATLAQIDPEKEFAKGDNRIKYGELKARFDKLTPEAQTIYRQTRDMYADHYNKVREAIKDRIERSELSASRKKEMMAKMDDDFFKKVKGVYFPLARFGSYVMVTKDAFGEVVNVTRAETLNEAQQARRQIMAAFPKEQGYTTTKVMKDAEFNPGRDAVGKGFMADLFETLDQKGVDDALRDAVSQLYLSSLPDLSWAKHGIHRKGTPGFSQDARRAFAQNMFHGARYLAKLRYADQMQAQLEQMQEHIKAYQGVDEYDGVLAQQVVDEMVKRHENLMNPKVNPVSTALTSIGFVFHLGLSPASAMVNLTQTALVAYPIMGAKWGYNRASAALLKASQEVVRAKNDLSKFLTGDELDAFNKAVKDGTIDVTMAHDLAGISQGEDQKVVWAMRPVMRAASFMFHHAEKFNRQATFMAAYRLSKAAGKDSATAYEEAKKATYDGHYDYAASNRPRIMQGNWQKVIFLFKQYAQNMIYSLSRNAYLSVKALDPAERTQARKTLAGILAMHASAAGILGLPLVGPLLAAASFMGGDDDEPWDAEVAMQNMLADAFGPKAAEVIARGFSRLTPFDLSGRVALNKLILPDVYEGLEGQQWAESFLTGAAGPVAGIFTGFVKGLQKIMDGDYQRGLEDMMPAALRGPLKALRYGSEGAVDKSGVVILDDVGPAGVVGQALGLSPSEVRRATERKGAIMDYDRALADRRSTLMRQWSEARMASDSEGMVEAMEEIQAFNQKNPARRITVPNLLQSFKARQKRINEAEDGVYLPRNRRDANDAVTF